jgi:hypothetical protein
VRGVLFLQVAILALRAVFDDDFVDRLPAMLRLLARLTNEAGAVEYVLTVLRYITGVRPEATPELLRKAIDAAAIEGGEELMTTWVDDLIEQGKQIGMAAGKVKWKAEGKAEEALRFVESLLQYRFGPLDARCARLAQLPLERLEALSTVILDAHTIDDVNAFLMSPASH